VIAWRVSNPNAAEVEQGLKINVSKTKFMVFRREGHENARLSLMQGLADQGQYNDGKLRSGHRD